MLIWLALSAMGAQNLPLAEVVAATVAGEARQVADLAEYTFEYEYVVEEFSRKGQPSGRTVTTGEIYMSARGSVEVVLTRNGRPLQGRDLARERKAAAAKLEADAKARLAGGAAGAPASAGRAGVGMAVDGARMSAMDILRYCALREVARSGDQLDLTFGQCQSPWPEERHYAQLEGEMRLDLARQRVDQWKARVNGRVLFEQTTQLAPGGQRVLAYHRLDETAAPAWFGGRRRAFSARWTKPQRFEVGVEQALTPPGVNR